MKGNVTVFNNEKKDMCCCSSQTVCMNTVCFSYALCT